MKTKTRKSARLIALLLAPAFALICVFGCTPKDGAPHAPAADDGAAPTAGGVLPLGIRPANGNGLSAEGSVEGAYVEASNAFTAALIESLGEEWTGVVSPVSFSLMLQMLANGADERTGDSILAAMLSSLGLEATNENAARLISALRKGIGAAGSSSKASELNISSAIIANKGDSFAEKFESALSKFFDASVGTLDFSKTDEALKQINSWVKQNTNDMIPELFSELAPDTSVALINALSFKGSWSVPFTAYRLPEGSPDASLVFFNGQKLSVPVPYLYVNSTFDYVERDGVKTVLLPYADGEYCMAVVLPAEGGSAGKALTDMLSHFSECSPARVEVKLPAVSLETKLDAMKLLPALGLGGIANGSTQFSELLDDSSIRISQFVHGAVLKVTEAGTEAAAATGVTGPKSAMPVDPEYKLYCDRPYAMAIVHAATGSVVFASVVNDFPTN